MIEDACGFIETGLQQIHTAPQKPLQGTDAFLGRLEMLAERTLTSSSVGGESEKDTQQDPQLIQLFLNEGLDILLDADAILDAWAKAPDENEQLDKLVLELRQLARGAEIANLPDVSELADLLERTYAAVMTSSIHPDDDFFAVARAGHEAVINMMDQVAAGLSTRGDAELLARLQEKLAHFRSEADDAFATNLDEIDTGFEEELDLSATLPEVQTDEPETLELEETPSEDFDPELTEIFLEEATDLIEGTGERLHQWVEQPDNNDLLRHLLRDLHTLKGGARLADISPIGDLSHELETLFEALTDNHLATSDALSDLLLRSHDRLAIMIEAISLEQPPRPAPDLINEIQTYISMNAGVPGAPEATLETEDEDDLELMLPEAEVLESEDDDSESEPLDPELAEIFMEEAGEIIDTTADQLHQWQSDPHQPELVKELQRELHTLKGGARMAEIGPIADIAHEMETLFEYIVDGRLEATPARTEIALRAHDQLATMVDAIAETGQCSAAPDVLEALKAALLDNPAAAAEVSEDAGDDEETESTEVQADLPATEHEAEAEAEAEAENDEPEHSDALADFDPELVGIFLEEAYDLINSTGSALHSWTENPGDQALAAQLQRDVHTLKGGAKLHRP